jgi:hypothetical protein
LMELKRFLSHQDCLVEKMSPVPNIFEMIPHYISLDKSMNEKKFGIRRMLPSKHISHLFTISWNWRKFAFKKFCICIYSVLTKSCSQGGWESGWLFRKNGPNWEKLVPDLRVRLRSSPVTW